VFSITTNNTASGTVFKMGGAKRKVEMPVKERRSGISGEVFGSEGNRAMQRKLHYRNRDGGVANIRWRVFGLGGLGSVIPFFSRLLCIQGYFKKFQRKPLEANPAIHVAS